MGRLLGEAPAEYEIVISKPFDFNQVEGYEPFSLETSGSHTVSEKTANPPPPVPPKPQKKASHSPPPQATSQQTTPPPSIRVEEALNTQSDSPANATRTTNVTSPNRSV